MKKQTKDSMRIERDICLRYIYKYKGVGYVSC